MPDKQGVTLIVFEKSNRSTITTKEREVSLVNKTLVNKLSKDEIMKEMITKVLLFSCLLLGPFTAR